MPTFFRGWSSHKYDSKGPLEFAPHLQGPIVFILTTRAHSVHSRNKELMTISLDTGLMTISLDNRLMTIALDNGLMTISLDSWLMTIS